ncbi:hypothetical protein D3H35_21240 [Cohnella faecalis]|uniref:Uncharacterized protein n=1 Tax=Cohnella faecalis TaxID=2315694 RepID=A0A398CW41_9BACL|nr:hypothetical protein D3H35_21240 [Cohnella faecalis]
MHCGDCGNVMGGRQTKS